MMLDKVRNDYDQCFQTLHVDTSSVLDISAWYCIAQWLLDRVGEEYRDQEIMRSTLTDSELVSKLNASFLADYSIEGNIEGVTQLCSVIYENGFTEECAVHFYLDYLPCAVADRSFFIDTDRPFSDHGAISCSMIHLSLVLAGEVLGTKDIFSIFEQEIFAEHRSSLEALGVSEYDLELYWCAVHFLDAVSAIKPLNMVRDVINTCRQNDISIHTFLDCYEKELQNKSSIQLIKEIRKSNKKNFAGPERGLTTKEQLLKDAAFKLIKVNPTDVIYSAFYPGRDDSPIESAFVNMEIPNIIVRESNVLIVNPSPGFFVEFNENWSRYWDGSGPSECPKVTFAVIDKTLSTLYRNQFRSFRFVLIDELKNMDSKFHNLVILARDHDTAPLWNAFALCEENAYITILAPQRALSNKSDGFIASMKEHQIYAERITEVPAGLCESSPRKKMILSARKGIENKTDTVSLICCTTNEHKRYLIPEKVNYTVPTTLLSRNMTLAKIRNYVVMQASGDTTEPRESKVYDFSSEIKLCYNLILKEGKIEKARAYYRNIHRPQTERARSKGKRPNHVTTERGLRGKSVDEILSKLESVPFYEEFYDDIVADIVDFYHDDMSRLTIKTVWFCCRKSLLNLISYDDERAMKLFCGECQILSNLIVGDSVPDDYIAALETMYGENGAGKSEWLQIFLVLQEAVRAGIIEKNPLESVMQVVKEEDRGKLYILNASLKKICFTYEEENRMISYLFEQVSLPGKRGGLLPRYVVESKYLACAFSLFAGLPIREICPLCWGDLHEIQDTGEMQIYITKHLNSSGVTISNVNYHNKHCFRKVAVSVILKKMLLRRKQYLMDVLGYTEAELEDIPIILEKEPNGRIRKNTKLITRRAVLKVNKQLLEVAQIPDDLISLLEGEEKFDVNLNANTNDLFAANFRHMAYHLCGFTPGELCYHVGNRAPDTFSRHYCDYGNDGLQVDMVDKLSRWVYIYESENSVKGPIFLEKTISGSLDFSSGRFAAGRAHVDLTLKCPDSTEGKLLVEIACKHGLKGTAIGIRRRRSI